MKSQVISRMLATFTVGAVVLVGASSGAFGAFSLVMKEGQTCTGYSYGYDATLAQYGWWYECNIPTPVGPGGGGGGWGGGGTPMTIPTTTPQANPVFVPPEPTPTPATTSNPVTPTVGDPATAEQPITRAQFVKILAEAFGYEDVSSQTRFRDVNYRSKYARYISFGVEMGWINIRNNRFRPNDIITRGEAQKLINVINGNAIADTVADPTATVTRAEAVQMIIDWLGL